MRDAREREGALISLRQRTMRDIEWMGEE